MRTSVRVECRERDPVRSDPVNSSTPAHRRHLQVDMRGHTESRNLHLFARVRCFSLVALAAVLLFGECRADSQTGKKATQKAANLVIVSTAQELQDAVVLGAPHIQIRAHLDLANLSLLEVLLLGELPATVQSITVRLYSGGLVLVWRKPVSVSMLTPLAFRSAVSSSPLSSLLPQSVRAVNKGMFRRLLYTNREHCMSMIVYA